jgi:hypothetical protein
MAGQAESRIPGSFDKLRGQYRVASRRHRRAGHDAHGIVAGYRSCEGDTRKRIADHPEGNSVVRRGPFGGLCHDGVSVHRRAIETRDVHVADNRR